MRRNFSCDVISSEYLYPKYIITLITLHGVHLIMLVSVLGTLLGTMWMFPLIVYQTCLAGVAISIGNIFSSKLA
jgi:hypothetical protein